MRWYSFLALYLLFWVFSLFVVLPFGVRTPDEAGEAAVPGQAESAPTATGLVHKLFAASVMAAAILVLFWANRTWGWITIEHLLALYPDF